MGKYTVLFDRGLFDRLKDINWVNLAEDSEVHALYHNLAVKIEYLENTRRGFYCILCDAENRDNISYNKYIDWLYDSRIYYDWEFCVDIHRNIFSTTFNIWRTLDPWVADIMHFFARI